MELQKSSMRFVSVHHLLSLVGRGMRWNRRRALLHMLPLHGWDIKLILVGDSGELLVVPGVATLIK